MQTVALGHFPFIAFTLAVFFAGYAYLRKTACIGAVDGLFVEAVLFLPITLGLTIFWTVTGTGAFLSGVPHIDLFLVLSGPVTALPLALFAAGARRLRLSTIGFLQYLAPAISLLIAIFVFREKITWAHIVNFGGVCLALVLLAFEGAPARLKLARAGSAPSDAPLPLPPSPPPG